MTHQNSKSFRCSSLASGNPTELDHVLLLKDNRKPYMGCRSLITLSHLSISVPERSKSRVLRLRPVSHKRFQSGRVLPLYTNRRLHMVSPIYHQSGFILKYLQKLKQRSLTFWKLICRKRAMVGHMLVLYTNRKPYRRCPMPPSHLIFSDTERAQS